MRRPRPRTNPAVQSCDPHPPILTSHFYSTPVAAPPPPLAPLFPVRLTPNSWSTSPRAPTHLHCPLANSTFRPIENFPDLTPQYVKAPDGRTSLHAHFPRGSVAFNPPLSFYAPARPGPRRPIHSERSDARLLRPLPARIRVQHRWQTPRALCVSLSSLSAIPTFSHPHHYKKKSLPHTHRRRQQPVRGDQLLRRAPLRRLLLRPIHVARRRRR